MLYIYIYIYYFFLQFLSISKLSILFMLACLFFFTNILRERFLIPLYSLFLETDFTEPVP